MSYTYTISKTLSYAPDIESNKSVSTTDKVTFLPEKQTENEAKQFNQSEELIAISENTINQNYENIKMDGANNQAMILSFSGEVYKQNDVINGNNNNFISNESTIPTKEYTISELESARYSSIHGSS